MANKQFLFRQHSWPIPPHSAGINAPLARQTSNTMEGTRRRENSTRARPKPADLEARYGKIGISAVAAAARYQSATLSPDPGPLEPAIEQKDRADADA